MYLIPLQAKLHDIRKVAAWTLFQAAFGVLLTACTVGTTQQGLTISGQQQASADKLVVVDCLPPARMIRAGHGITFLGSSKPIKTTVLECEDMGGKHAISPLEAWLPDAEKGDKVAQTRLGEAYEKGLGIKQDYARAAEWYRKAAEQGDARAQTNLGFLFEKGLGVPKDLQAAIKWQRKAAGLGELNRGSASTTELIKITKERDRQQNETGSLRRQLEQTQQQLEYARQELQSLRGQARVETQRTIDSLQRELSGTQAELRRLQQENIELAKRQAKLYPQKILLPAGLDLGSYHALIIGNGNYSHWDRLETAINDARQLDEILRRKYGFKTKVLIDADRDRIADTLDEFRRKLSENDNLLVYYSGHGQIDSHGFGYWLPVDADRDKQGKWIDNEAIARLLDIMPARHVLVIADSCYSGVMTSTSLATVPGDMSPADQKLWIEKMSQGTSRAVISSGGLEPVLATGGSMKHSVFAEALIKALETHEGVMEGRRLYNEISPRVYVAANRLGIPQLPDYKAFKGQHGGEFLFVPKTNLAGVERRSIGLGFAFALQILGEK